MNELDRLRHTLRHRHWSGWALVRSFYWRHIRRYESEVCHHCGRPVRIVWWDDDNDRYHAATGEPRVGEGRDGRGRYSGVYCAPCYQGLCQPVEPIRFDVGALS